MWAVETNRLSKSYGRVKSLVNCNLQVPQGCVFGLLGPNGAGKSTLLRTLLGFLKPTSGSALIGGFDVQRQSLEARRQASYLPGDARLMRSMRGTDLLRLFSGLHPLGSLPHSLTVAERLQLEHRRRVMFMSTGMRQKLALSIVLGCQAPLIVLDEPTANLDPNVRSEVVELVKEVRQQGRTVVLSSHIFSDIDETCDRVAILRDGEIVAEQNMAELQQSHIVIGRSQAADTQLTQWRNIEREQQPLIRHLQSTDLPDGSRRLEIHLAGPPHQWLAWLERQPLQDVRIESGGIRTLYQRFHRSVPAE